MNDLLTWVSLGTAVLVATGTWLTAKATWSLSTTNKGTLDIMSNQLIPVAEAAKRESLTQMGQHLLDTGGIAGLKQMGSIILFSNPGRKIPGVAHSPRTLTLIVVDTASTPNEVVTVMFHYSQTDDLVADFEQAIANILKGHVLHDADREELRYNQAEGITRFQYPYEASADCFFLVGVYGEEEPGKQPTRTRRQKRRQVKNEKKQKRQPS